MAAAVHRGDEPQFLALDGEHGQDVLAAGGGPDEAAVGRGDDARGVGVARRCARQHRGLGQRGQDACCRVPAADGDGRAQFVDDVRVRAAGVESQVARPRAGTQSGLPVQGQGAVRQRAHPHRVRAQVDADGPAAARVGLHVVGVRPLLAGGVRPRAAVPEHAGSGTREGAVGADGDRGDAAGAVVGGQDMAVEQVEVGRAAAVDRHGPPGRVGLVPVHPVRGHRAVGRLTDRVERPPVGREGQTGGVLNGVDAAQHGQRAAAGVDLRGHDPGAAGRRERPDVRPSPAVRHRCPLSPAPPR